MQRISQFLGLSPAGGSWAFFISPLSLRYSIMAGGVMPSLPTHMGQTVVWAASDFCFEKSVGLRLLSVAITTQRFNK
jgi:hypothetical protein